MKKTFQIMDLFFIVFFGFIFSSFFLSESALDTYENIASSNPFTTGFFKFALLATFGESLAQRIAFGTYFPKNYGLFPKAIIWGLLGVVLTAAFIIYSNGTPIILDKLGFLWGTTALTESFSMEKFVTALTISITMNTLFTPILMLSHSLTDAHIAEYNGSLQCLIRKPHIIKYLQQMNWEHFWKLAIVRNILFFWIPIHTITFLLPEAYRVLFAALGLILTFIKVKSKPPRSILKQFED